jgi:hypothetical protein
MRLITLAALLGGAVALPQAPPTGANSTGTLFSAITGLLGKLDLTDNNSNDLSNGPCRDAYLLVARGSGEWGTLVSIPVFSTGEV